MKGLIQKIQLNNTHSHPVISWANATDLDISNAKRYFSRYAFTVGKRLYSFCRHKNSFTTQPWTSFDLTIYDISGKFPPFSYIIGKKVPDLQLINDGSTFDIELENEV